MVSQECNYTDSNFYFSYCGLKAENLDLPYLNAFLDAVGSNFSHGANFATAGSTIRPQNTTLHQVGGFSPFSLNVQFYQFNDFHRRTQIFRKKGNNECIHVLLFVVLNNFFPS